MIRGGSATCASCASFPRESLQGAGMGVCAIFGKPQAYFDSACVLHDPAKDRAQRRALAVRLMQSK
jgi:hypothetical protein